MKKFATFLFLVLFISILPNNPASAQTINAPLLISEIQTEGCEAEDTTSCVPIAANEVIELYNATDSPINFEDSVWLVQYKKAVDGSWITKATLQGQIEPTGFFVLSTYLSEHQQSFASGLSKTDGHIRLVQIVNGEEVIIDQVGWGNADSPEAEPATAPQSGFSLQRCFSDNQLIDTSNNKNDFNIYETTSFGSGVLCPQTPQNKCDGIILSEILPNPGSSDKGNEFIEIFNPTTNDINLLGCSLQLDNGKIFDLPNKILATKKYLAFNDLQTGLTLPNSTATTVWLITASEESGVQYQDNLDSDQSWALFNKDWNATYKATPGSSNQLVTEVPLAPCPAGQTRNPSTNRCRNIAASATVTPCKPGQTRNPTTNRCRKISTASTLKPCEAGKTRNPLTNRCRTMSLASASLKPCAANQIRNPQTNRCRKTNVSSSVADVKDVIAPQSGNNNWALIVGVTLLLGAAGYAIYEWRENIRRFIHKRTK